MDTMFLFDNLNFLWSLGTGAVLTIALVLFIFHKLKKQNPLKAPTGMLMVAEMYVTGFYNMFDDMLNGKMKFVIPYLFTLFNYIFVLSLLPLFGFPSLPANILFTMTLATITMLGIFVVGIFSTGVWKYIKQKYSNPTNLFSQFAPFISLSVRLFAATLASGFIGEIVEIILVTLTDDASWLIVWPLMSAFWSWGWSIVSVFLSLIQTFVFVALTAIYWVNEYGYGFNRKERKKYYAEKKKHKHELALQKHEQKKELKAK